MDSRYSASLFKPTPAKLAICLLGFTGLSLAFRMISGMPPGGDNLCDGYNLDKCTQGYITSENIDPEVVYQFNRQIQSLHSATDGTLKQLAECITVDKTGNALIAALAKANNSRSISSCGASAEWASARASSDYYETSRDNISQTACDAYKLAFAAVVASCEDGGMAFAYDLAIAACIMGGIIGVALCTWGACKVRTCAESYSCNCCEKNEEAAPGGP